jgi:hypothetical protein
MSKLFTIGTRPTRAQAVAQIRMLAAQVALENMLELINSAGTVLLDQSDTQALSDAAAVLRTITEKRAGHG